MIAQARQSPALPGPARDALAELLGERARFDVPMSSLTSLRVGGPADVVAEPADRAELARILEICALHRVPHQTLGAGFNTLVLDAPVPGVVLRLGRFRLLERDADGTLRVEVGVSHSQLTRFCVERGLAGLEFGAGIPGSVGGWLAMNAGIPKREVADVVREIEVMGPADAAPRHLDREQLRFVYRGLQGLEPGAVLVSARLAVQVSERASVKAEVDRMLAARAGSQPLNVPTCGSVFKNPPGDFAGRLIESVGLKGRRVGGAQISPVHANFIANVGGASAADVLALIELARGEVRAATGIELEPEVRIVGQAA